MLRKRQARSARTRSRAHRGRRCSAGNASRRCPSEHSPTRRVPAAKRAVGARHRAAYGRSPAVCQDRVPAARPRRGIPLRAGGAHDRSRGSVLTPVVVDQVNTRTVAAPPPTTPAATRTTTEQPQPTPTPQQLRRVMSLSYSQSSGRRLRQGPRRCDPRPRTPRANDHRPPGTRAELEALGIDMTRQLRYTPRSYSTCE